MKLPDAVGERRVHAALGQRQARPATSRSPFRATGFDGPTSFRAGKSPITSLALKLALFDRLESPLFLLDEVEPSLDYTNHKSMQAFLKDVASNKQLIMITHLRSTIELANTLHGVRTRFDGSSFMKFYFVMDQAPASALQMLLNAGDCRRCENGIMAAQDDAQPDSKHRLSLPSSRPPLTFQPINASRVWVGAVPGHPVVLAAHEIQHPRAVLQNGPVP